MIFLGDIAVPTGLNPKVNGPSNISGSPVVANLEGAIVFQGNGRPAGKNPDQL